MNTPLRRYPALSAVLTLSAVARAQSASEVLIPAGSPWRYRDTGVNLGAAWRDPGYADGTWASGLAEPGYADGGEAPCQWQ